MAALAKGDLRTGDFEEITGLAAFINGELTTIELEVMIGLSFFSIGGTKEESGGVYKQDGESIRIGEFKQVGEAI